MNNIDDFVRDVSCEEMYHDNFDEDWNDDESKADYIYYSSISQYDYDD